MARNAHHRPHQDPFAPLAPITRVNPHEPGSGPTARQELAEVLLGLLAFGIFVALVMFFANGGP